LIKELGSLGTPMRETAVAVCFIRTAGAASSEATTGCLDRAKRLRTYRKHVSVSVLVFEFCIGVEHQRARRAINKIVTAVGEHGYCVVGFVVLWCGGVGLYVVGR
jgi:hypothetical protein